MSEISGTSKRVKDSRTSRFTLHRVPAAADRKIYFTNNEGLAKCEVNWKSYRKTMVERFCEGDSRPFTDSLIPEMVAGM
jgi:hypothetical protein